MTNNKPEITVGSDRIKRWFLNGKLHREDGPAVEHLNGSKEWWVDGKRHRENGPAIEASNGAKFWYLHGKFHRIDGPAVHHSDGSEAFYLFGEWIEDEKVYKASSSILKFIWLKHDKNQ
jgi:hypothetical protein